MERNYGLSLDLISIYRPRILALRKKFYDNFRTAD